MASDSGHCDHPNIKRAAPEWMAYSGEFVIRLTCFDCHATTEIDLGDVLTEDWKPNG